MTHPALPAGLPGRGGDAGDKPGRNRLIHYGDAAYPGMANVPGGMDAGIPAVRTPGEDPAPDRREEHGRALEDPHARR